MAKIGLKNFRYGVLTEALDGTATYGIAKKPGKAISCSVSVNNNDVKLYADDVVAESDTSFSGGTVTMGIDDEDDTIMADLLGHTITNGEMVRSSADVAPYVGLGRIVTKMVGGVLKYKVEFLAKVKFAEASQENNTRGESVEFGTSELEGQIMTLADGTWSKTETFNTYDEAEEYLESFFGEGTAATVAFNAGSGSGSYDSVSTFVGAIIPVPNGSALTPPTGKVFAGWDTTSTATTPDITDSYKVTGASVTLYAIYVDE